MTNSLSVARPATRSLFNRLARTAGGAGLALGAVAALGVAPRASATSWWLPPNYSEHGRDIDALFVFIFWLTLLTMVGVFAVMAYFLVRYRYNPERRKAHFTHGNPRLEMMWTIIPAIILAGISIATKGIWDKYRQYDPKSDPSRPPAEILVIGQQFKWNVVYPGADGKMGRYLVFPKPTDKLWPRNKDGSPFFYSYSRYQNTAGPADMPFDEAVAAISAYIDQVNPLGKVFDDKDGLDDGWSPTPGREINVPVHRPVVVQLSSKDVIHSFYLPNFRVKLDAVPGMRGQVTFVPTVTSKEIEDKNRAAAKPVPIDELIARLREPENRYAELLIALDDKAEPKAKDDKSAGAVFDKKSRTWRYVDKDGKTTIVRDGLLLSVERLEQLKAIGVKQVTAFRPGYFELVCEELCGGQHYTMRGTLVVLSRQDYAEQFEGKAPRDDDAEAAAPAPGEAGGHEVARASRP